MDCVQGFDGIIYDIVVGWCVWVGAGLLLQIYEVLSKWEVPLQGDFCYIMEVFDHKTLMYDLVED